MVLAPLVLVHIVTVIYAIRGGLSAAEILSRTQGSLFWGGLYGLFVLAAALPALALAQEKAEPAAASATVSLSDLGGANGGNTPVDQRADLGHQEAGEDEEDVISPETVQANDCLLAPQQIIQYR
ncbi:MAG: hypothetical protein IH919_05675 [Deltaproteobacteria bacterium]|nr:hypothetical protein [Deltaproteobacteria bacterium]